MERVILFQIVLLSVQGLLYLGVQKLEGPAHDVSCRIDEKIPFWTPSVLVYVLWYPLIAIFPLWLYAAGSPMYEVYILAIIADIVLSSIVYLTYPSSFQRPLPPNTFTGKIVALLYRVDYTGKNCMPSMHCSMCFIIMYFAVLSMSIALAVAMMFFILALLIVISTVLTKQHVIVDVATGLLAAGVSVGVATVLMKVIG